ncbi:MAG: hypothetical protein ACI4R9_02790 [Kiritimatiellia bacterium]
MGRIVQRGDGMRFLFLSQASRVEDQPDFHASLLKVFGVENYRNIPYQGLYAQGGWPLLEQTVCETNEDFRPDVVYFQFFHAPEAIHPRSLVRALKASFNHPMILGSIGDLFDTGPLSGLGRPLPPSVTELVSEADAFFSTSMGRTADELVKKHGARNLVFLPNAYCPEHFPLTDTMPEKEYDVLMLGRSMRMFGRHPIVTIPTAVKRRYVVHRLVKAFGDRFAIYGYGWKGTAAKGGVPFREQVAVFRRSKVVVDAPPRVAEELYSSDRACFIAGSGSSLVMAYVPRFDLLFEPDIHAHFVYRLRDTVEVCRNVLSLPDDVRSANERKTVEYIRSRNLISNRVDTILSTIEALQKQRSGEFSKEEALDHLRLWHFRPELPRETYMPYAVANWRG